MKKTYILLIILLSFIFIGSIYILIPYRSQSYRVTKYIEEKYNKKNDFKIIKNEKDRYIFKDTTRDIEFNVELVHYRLGQNGLNPLPHTSIYDDLNKSIIASKLDEANELAKNYDLIFRKDRLYVDSFEKLPIASEFFFELVKLYDLEPVDLIREDFIFCYGEISGDKVSNSVELDYLSYISVMQDGHHLFFKDTEELTHHLEEKWMDKARYKILEEQK